MVITHDVDVPKRNQDRNARQSERKAIYIYIYIQQKTRKLRNTDRKHQNNKDTSENENKKKTEKGLEKRLSKNKITTTNEHLLGEGEQRVVRFMVPPSIRKRYLNAGIASSSDRHPMLHKRAEVMPLWIIFSFPFLSWFIFVLFCFVSRCFFHQFTRIFSSSDLFAIRVSRASFRQCFRFTYLRYIYPMDNDHCWTPRASSSVDARRSINQSIDRSTNDQ